MRLSLVLALVVGAIGCEPTHEERFYINARDLLLAERAKPLPVTTTIATLTQACKNARKDSDRIRVARKLLQECEPLPEVWYYEKALAVFPQVLAGSLPLSSELKWACEAANSSLDPAWKWKPEPRIKDRDRLPAARRLAEECDRSLEKMTKTSP
jgi:hypothetical protein